MADMRVLVAGVSGTEIQFAATLNAGESVGGVVTLSIGGNLNVQHTAIIDAAKAVMTAQHGTSFPQNSQIELWSARVS